MPSVTGSSASTSSHSSRRSIGRVRPKVTVARVPRGHLFEPMEYWDGTGWQPDRTRAKSIVPATGRRINADQFEWTGERFVSVNKEGDWWGDRILLAESTSPTGPFEVYDVIEAPVKCDPAECNSFFATWVPADAARRTDGSLVISLAHNRWDGVVSSLYRPSFHRVAAPTYLPPGGTIEVRLPPGTAAAAINVAVVGAGEPGFITAYPCDRRRPNASNVNHVHEPVVSNLVFARSGRHGSSVSLFAVRDGARGRSVRNLRCDERLPSAHPPGANRRHTSRHRCRTATSRRRRGAPLPRAGHGDRRRRRTQRRRGRADRTGLCDRVPVRSSSTTDIERQLRQRAGRVEPGRRPTVVGGRRVHLLPGGDGPRRRPVGSLRPDGAGHARRCGPAGRHPRVPAAASCACRRGAHRSMFPPIPTLRC